MKSWKKIAVPKNWIYLGGGKGLRNLASKGLKSGGEVVYNIFEKFVHPDVYSPYIPA